MYHLELHTHRIDRSVLSLYRKTFGFYKFATSEWWADRKIWGVGFQLVFFGIRLELHQVPHS